MIFDISYSHMEKGPGIIYNLFLLTNTIIHHLALGACMLRASATATYDYEYACPHLSILSNTYRA